MSLIRSASFSVSGSAISEDTPIGPTIQGVRSQACTARTGTSSRTASVTAIRSAASASGESSKPTTTGPPAVGVP